MEKNQNEALAVKVSTVSILVNLILSLIKLLAGVKEGVVLFLLRRFVCALQILLKILCRHAA